MRKVHSFLLQFGIRPVCSRASGGSIGVVAARPANKGAPARDVTPFARHNDSFADIDKGWSAPSFKLSALLVVGWIGLGLAAPAAAEDGPTRPTLQLIVTVPAWYNSNFGLSRTDRVDGLNSAPVAQLSLDGNITESLSYSATADIDPDRYDKTGFDSDSLGAAFSLTYKVLGWSLTGSYSGAWNYTAYFKNFDARFDDYEFGAAAPAISLGVFGGLLPSFGYRERVSTDRISSHHSPLISLGWKKELDGAAKGWTAEASFSTRYLVYDDRPITANDWKFRQEISLNKNLLTNLRLKLLVQHENRESNILEREYDAWKMGANLVLTFNIF